MKQEQRPRVRFAPSPTGYLHVGGARSALFNWLFARHYGGQFILRIEDTDRTRYQEDALDDLLSGLRWLGLDWDEGPEAGGPYGPYFQSERTDIYRRYAEQLIAEGHAYKCFCSPDRLAQMRKERQARKEPAGYDRRCRGLTAQQRRDREARGETAVVRFKMPLEGETRFHDQIRGDIVVQNETLDDFVLLKTDRFPTYHLANVVDDHLMAITHVLRADEWLPSVPKHVQLYAAFGWTPPLFAHLPIILDPSGKGKMSKRKKLAGNREAYVHLKDFRAAGYLPEALFNFLALIGWSYDDHTEIITRQQLIDHFDLDQVKPSAAAFSYEKLDWMNGQYIRTMPVDDLAARLLPVLRDAGLSPDMDTLRALVPLIRVRIKRLPDAVDLVDSFFVPEVHPTPHDLVGKKQTVDQTRQLLDLAYQTLASLPTFAETDVETALRAVVTGRQLKPNAFFGPIRVAVTGKKVSPPLFGTIHILGRERVLQRLQAAITLLQE
ncbi:MAG: glutamate--tRNA ligase [Chloroflexi bacterium]|nr:glutamate--tRNA ligase [Chloroflexota bacterium]